MNTILVTGAAGFIGANLIRKLLHEKAQIHAIVRPGSDLIRLRSILSHIHLHEVDFEDFEKLELVIKQISPSVIFHLAAHGVLNSHRDRVKILRSNILGTYNLLTTTQKIDYESFIHMGGSSEYGKKNMPMSEKDFLNPSTFYGLSKACTTLLAKQFAEEFNKPICILRAFSVYGPYEASSRLIPTAIDAALTGKSIKLTAQGYSRDYIYVDDVVDACILSWKKKLQGGIFNIGTGIQTTNEQVIQLIEKLMGKKISISEEIYPPHLSDHFCWVADISKTKKILKWNPKHTFEEGLKKTIQNYETIY